MQKKNERNQSNHISRDHTCPSMNNNVETTCLCLYMMHPCRFFLHPSHRELRNQRRLCKKTACCLLFSLNKHTQEGLFDKGNVLQQKEKITCEKTNFKLGFCSTFYVVIVENKTTMTTTTTNKKR